MFTKELEKEALELKPKDKISLVEKLLYSLDKPDPEIEAQWVNESEVRYEAYKAGELEGIPLNEVKKKFEK